MVSCIKNRFSCYQLLLEGLTLIGELALLLEELVFPCNPSTERRPPEGWLRCCRATLWFRFLRTHYDWHRLQCTSVLCTRCHHNQIGQYRYLHNYYSWRLHNYDVSVHDYNYYNTSGWKFRVVLDQNPVCLKGDRCYRVSGLVMRVFGLNN